MIALLGVPYDGSSSSRRGAAGAPAAIRAALERMREFSNRFTESGVDLDAAGILRDAGDVRSGDPAATRTAIAQAVAKLTSARDRPLVLGGDHSISYPVLAAMREALGPLDVVHLDAHPDLYPEFQGDRYSHACPFARALEEGAIGRLVQVGIRAATPPQREMAKRYGVEQLAPSQWLGDITLEFTRPVYVSLDLDALDPAFAPGVSHPEPGGLSVRQLLTLLQRIRGEVVGADLVEYNPDLDRDGATGLVAAKLVKELAARLTGISSGAATRDSPPCT